MKSYKFLNNLFGWVAFAVAAIVYLLTIEPTASFWDCGEFITSAYKFEVGHPPGAPMFMLLGRFFTLFAGGTENIAMMVNALSALASAFTILFLFWTITHLAKRLVIGGEAEPSLTQMIAVLGAGMVGALAYTFSDSFWFSAVEGEVYATSSLITALVFWAILKWENVADERYANRWLVLIAYIVGLSIGVHLLNLLAIPAIVFVYYYKKYSVTRKGILLSIGVSVLLLAVVMYGIVSGLVTVASKFELFFVNSIGLPYNWGGIIYIVLLLSLLVWGIYVTWKKKKIVWNTVLTCLGVILIGYSSFAIIVIRSNANTPMEQNDPDDVFSLLYYLNREQYGQRPLFYGQYYNSPLDKKKRFVKAGNIYAPKDGKYVVAIEKKEANYDRSFCTFFPRMWSDLDPKHIEEYKKWGEIDGIKMRYVKPDGEVEMIEKPTFGQNLRFFFSYQVGYMYLRYFMWNFAGRQNDIQGHGGILHGNWISGIDFIDSARLGPQDNLPEEYAKNPGRNKYYFLPLLLGILGIFFQYNSGRRGRKDLWIVTLLFVMTGFAIVVYLNQNPLQPRERDYAYAGSFYAFAIWIGLGVLGLIDLIKKIAPAKLSAIAAVLLTLIFVPGIMASENWDDHDRSGRYVARDFGHNYLVTCKPNAVIFTNGDNDTFPLWYNQEVEGVRTDVRVCNLSYLQTDWYIDQMKRKAYESEALPISFTPDQYAQGVRDAVLLFDDERVKEAVDLENALNFIKSDNPSTKLRQADNRAYLPTKKLKLTVDKEAVLKNGVVAEQDSALILDSLLINFGKRGYMTKDEMIVFDMLVTNNWERPIYYAITVGRDKYMNLDKYFQIEGLAYQLVPVASSGRGFSLGRIDTEAMYRNMMEKYRWGNINAPGVYLDENHRRMARNIRSNFTRLSDALIREGKKERAIEVLNKCLEVVPEEKVPYEYFGLGILENYFRAGEEEKGKMVTKKILKNLSEELEYFLSLDLVFMHSVESEINTSFMILQQITHVLKAQKQDELNKEASEMFTKYYKEYASIRS